MQRDKVLQLLVASKSVACYSCTLHQAQGGKAPGVPWFAALLVLPAAQLSSCGCHRPCPAVLAVMVLGLSSCAPAAMKRIMSHLEELVMLGKR